MIKVVQKLQSPPLACINLHSTEGLQLCYFSLKFHKCHFLVLSLLCHRPTPPSPQNNPKQPKTTQNKQKNPKLKQYSDINTDTIDLLNLTYEKYVYLYLIYQGNSFYRCCKYCYLLIT